MENKTLAKQDLILFQVPFPTRFSQDLCQTKFLMSWLQIWGIRLCATKAIYNLVKSIRSAGTRSVVSTSRIMTTPEVICLRSKTNLSPTRPYSFEFLNLEVASLKTNLSSEKMVMENISTPCKCHQACRRSILDPKTLIRMSSSVVPSLSKIYCACFSQRTASKSFDAPTNSWTFSPPTNTWNVGIALMQHILATT